MTTNELIDQLKKMPPDGEVFVYLFTSDGMRAFHPGVRAVDLDGFGGVRLRLNREVVCVSQTALVTMEEKP